MAYLPAPNQNTNAANGSLAQLSHLSDKVLLEPPLITGRTARPVMKSAHDTGSTTPSTVGSGFVGG